MAAAVADYTPVRPRKTKIKKADRPMTLKLKPTKDILDWAGRNKKKNQIVVGFALEDKDLRKNAERKLIEKNLDMIVANRSSVIGDENTEVQIKTSKEKWMRIPQAKKARIAGKIIALIEVIKFRSNRII